LLQGYNFTVLSFPTHATDVAATPLSAALEAPGVAFCGVLTPRAFDDVNKEIDALLHSAGVSDLGWRAKIRVTGTDRLRWLNGMVSNAVQSLPEGQGNYSFLLSAQGRIQGDCYVYQRADDLLLDTGRDQAPAVISHLDHFIIMDDVELADVSQEWTALSLSGPKASPVLATLGFVAPEAKGDNARMHNVQIGEVACTLVEARSQYELWFAPEHVLAVWETLQSAGATPCGLEAVEALRVFRAIPLYGIDIYDRDLPQETAQKRALNFNKGCYLGQEIVERIRSRGKVNRQLQQFTLQGVAPAQLPADLQSDGQSVGRITSVAALPGAGLLGLGFVRVEAVERNAAIAYDGGVAMPATGK
jgi:folate-binding protein YgfZ